MATETAAAAAPRVRPKLPDDGADRKLQQHVQALLEILAVRKPDRQAMDERITRITKIAHNNGLTSAQAESVLRLALGLHPELEAGEHLQTTVHVSPATAVRLIKAITPRAGHAFGPNFVLLVLGCLGAPQAQDHLNSEGSVSPRHIPDVKVQAAALRQLVLLFCPPPHSSYSLSAILIAAAAAGPRQDAIPIPSTFISTAGRSTLDKCYAILFHFLDFQILAPHLCHLLCRLTRRKHVKHYRISKLLTLSRQSSAVLQPALSALLTVYANFYPDLLFPDLIGASASTSALGLLDSPSLQGFPQPDLDWLGRVYWMHHNPSSIMPDLTLLDTRDPGNERDVTTRPFKRAKILQSSHDGSEASTVEILVPAASTLATQSDSVIISELSSVHHLSVSLVHLTLPSQLSSALTNRLANLAVLVDGDPAHADRIASWAISALTDALGIDIHFASSEPRRCSSSNIMPSTKSLSRTRHLFSLVTAFFRQHGSLPSRLERWLHKVVNCLGGSRYVPEIMSLLALHQPTGWKYARSKIFAPLERLAMSHSTSSSTRAHILHGSARLLELWGRIDWNGVERRRAGTKDLSTWSGSGDANYVELIERAAHQTNSLATRLLQVSPSSLAMQHATLDVYEVLSSPALSLVGLHQVVVPPLSVLHILSLRAGIMPLSRACGVIKDVNMAFMRRDAEEERETEDEISQVILEARDAYFGDHGRDELDQALLMLADIIWINKAFNSIEEGARGIDLEPSVIASLRSRLDGRGDNLGAVGSIPHGGALARLFEDWVNSQVQKEGYRGHLRAPITKSCITSAKKQPNFPSTSHGEFRTSFLNHLASRGAVGLRDHLYTSIKSLRGEGKGDNTMLLGL